ncbi:MAG: ATP-dependent DNA helicase RecQ [Rubrobacteraceae bacterium]
MPATPNPTDKPSRMLQELFGFSEFRPGQKAVIEAALKGRDVMAVMPTSGGKSLCYQVPALMADPEEGLTVVISPLVSLMKDQIDGLRSRLRSSGKPRDSVAALHSGLPAAERRRVERDVLSGKVRVLYVAPEKLRSLDTVLLLKRAGGGSGIYMIVVDEAHCISEWGHSFRPEYLFLATAVEALGKPVGKPGRKAGKERPPVMALTATADGRVREDIVELLGLRKPEVVQTGFDRPNLNYRVRWVAEGSAKGPAREPGNAKGNAPLGRMDTIVEALAEGEPPAIVYVHTRRQAEDISRQLSGLGIPAEAYHAGMSKAERDRVQGRFMTDDLPVIVATVAFGMGVDKPNVRTVIHAGVPASIPAYVQEAGRAGRDGRTAFSTVLFSPEELVRRKELASKGQTTADEARTFFNSLREISVREKVPGRTAGRVEGKAGSRKSRRRSKSQLRANPKAFDLPKLGGVGFEAATDALRALEDLGRVRRQYNVWAEVQVSIPRVCNVHYGQEEQSEPTEGIAADVMTVLRKKREELGDGTEGRCGADSFSVELPELARQAGATPAATQVALTRLTARGVVRARGRGILADLLVKPGPLSRRELLELTKRFEGRSAIEARHLEEIGRYASLTTCRRSRLLSYFGDGAARLVAPCDGCDVCNAGRNASSGSHKGNGTRDRAASAASSVVARALTGLRNVVFGSI